MSLSAAFPSPAVTSPSGQLMTTDAPLPAYKPEVAMAFARSNDRLIAMILQGITDSESRSIEGSLYVLLLACVRRFNTSLARQTQFRDMFNLIKGQAIGSVKAFVAALPEDVRLDAVNDESTKSVIEMAKMITAVEKILAQVPKQDTGNVGFYTRLKTEIEQGKITNFGELCERLPSFIVDHNEEMRQARHGFRNARDSKTTAITEFKNRAQTEIKLDIATTASGTSPSPTWTRPDTPRPGRQTPPW